MTERIGGKSSQPNPESRKLRHLKMDVLAGDEIGATITEAIYRAKQFGIHKMPTKVTFEFNGVNVSVRENSNPSLIKRDWNRALSGYIGSKVGPYPAKELTEEDKANDARIEAKNEARRKKADAEYRAKERAHQERVEAKLKDAPGIELSNEKVWQTFKDNNKDGYGGAVVSYSERWARLMQVEMAQGHSLENIADSASHEADVEGITGFMYGCAVSTLSAAWVHGKELRKWHNLKTQIGHEGEKANETGGTLNPALLSLGPKE